MGRGLIFPGQGSQAPGMAKAIANESPAALASLLRAERITGLPILRLCTEAPDGELRRTDVAQPAILATELAVLAGVRETFGLEEDDSLARLNVLAVAGHSLGEFCACVAAQSLTEETALRFVCERGRLMAEARAGAMAAVLGGEADAVAAICATLAGLVIANDNAPGQIVISGPPAAISEATPRLLEAGARRVVPLNVSGAFHSPLMVAAQSAFATLVAEAEIREPRVAVVGNTNARALTSAAEVRAELGMQMTAPVRWRESVLSLVEMGATSLIECGPGEVLIGLARRTVSGIALQAIHTRKDAGVLGIAYVRELALQALYEADATDHPAPVVIERLVEALNVPFALREEARHSVARVVRNLPRVDDEIAIGAPAWPVHQMARVERGILRLALSEGIGDNAATLDRASIDGALELARTFGGETSVKFVNGVLSSLAERHVPPAQRAAL